MKLVEPDYSQLLKQAHRRWIETRDPKDGDRFADLVMVVSSRQGELNTCVNQSRSLLKNL